MIRVLGIDPGGTTGLAFIHEVGTFEGGMGWGGGFDQHTPDEVVPNVKVVLEAGVSVVAMERFVVARRAGRSKTAGAGEQARNIIGAVTALCQEAGVPVVLRSASQVKRWATDKRLEAAGLLAPTRGLPHARDAARHALHAAVWDCGLPDPLTTQESS